MYFLRVGDGFPHLLLLMTPEVVGLSECVKMAGRLSCSRRRRGCGGRGRKVTADLKEGRRSWISNAWASPDLGLKGENYYLVGIDYWNVLRMATSIGIIPKIQKETVIYYASNSESRSRNSFNSSSSGSRFLEVQDDSYFLLNHSSRVESF